MLLDRRTVRNFRTLAELNYCGYIERVFVKLIGYFVIKMIQNCLFNKSLKTWSFDSIYTVTKSLKLGKTGTAPTQITYKYFYLYMLSIRCIRILSIRLAHDRT